MRAIYVFGQIVCMKQLLCSPQTQQNLEFHLRCMSCCCKNNMINTILSTVIYNTE